MFWCGDLNYRIDLPSSISKDHIAHQKWDKLCKQDQLIKQKKLNKVGEEGGEEGEEGRGREKEGGEGGWGRGEEGREEKQKELKWEIGRKKGREEEREGTSQGGRSSKSGGEREKGDRNIIMNWLLHTPCFYIASLRYSKVSARVK